MGSRRLLDRLRGLKGTPNAYGTHSHGETVDSVVSYLQKMLNSRQGTTLMDEEYGMPDFTDLAVLYPDSVRDIERAIAVAIQRYEPRLSHVQVDFLFQDEQSLSLTFHIRAMLTAEGDRQPVCLESAIDSGGKMRIKG